MSNASPRLAILGAGPGGYVAAIRAAQLGARVTLITDGELGGVCLHRGCIPTKAIIASIETLHRIRQAEEFGIEIRGEISWDLKKIMARKDRVVQNLARGVWGLLRSWGVEILEGWGRLTSPRTLRVRTSTGQIQTVEADRIILATGSEALRQGSFFAVDGSRILTSDEALVLEEVPPSLLVVGAGVVGCELAGIFHALGSQVILVDIAPHILPGVDGEIAGLLQREFQRRGIRIYTQARIERLYEGTDGVVHAHLADGQRLQADRALVSIGRTYNTQGIGLEEVGVACTPQGAVAVNARMETSIPGIYAIGDMTGGMMLAHVASAQGIVAVECALGREREMDYRVIPAGIFTIPEIGTVGLTEEEARKAGIEPHVGRFLFRGLGKAHATGEVTGMVKIVADSQTEKVVGVHIIGSHAADLIHEAAFAIRMGATLEDLAQTVHAHPTLAEAIKEAAEDGLGMALHLPRRR